MLEAPKHLFNLPDGSSLKYSPPGKKGSQSFWHRTHDKPDVWKASEKSKRRNFLVDCWSSSTDLCIVIADFDELPHGYCDFEALFVYLRSVFNSREAIIARSASGKVKVFFLIATPDVGMTEKIAIETLAKLFSFDPDLLRSLDFSRSGLRLSFLNRSVLEALSRGLSLLIPIPCVIPETDLETEREVNTSNTPIAGPYRTYSGPLRDVMPGAKVTDTAEGVLRILLASPQLLSATGFGISTPKIARELGKSQALISRVRRRFVSFGWLVPKEKHYIPGKRAIRFKAAGSLAAALRKLHPIVCDVSIPASIPNGQWNEQLKKIIRPLSHTHTLQETLDIVAKIKGSGIGTRMRQAKNWYLWYQKKATEANRQGLAGGRSLGA